MGMPSPVGTPRPMPPKKQSDGGIECAAAAGNNLSVQIEHIQDSDLDFAAAMTPSPRLHGPESLKIVKSHSMDTDASVKKNKIVKRTESFSNLFKNAIANECREHSRSKREISKIKKTQKREKWKYYQKQQASGIEYLTRYTVLVLLSSISSLMMIGVILFGLEERSDGEIVVAL